MIYLYTMIYIPSLLCPFIRQWTQVFPHRLLGTRGAADTLSEGEGSSPLRMRLGAELLDGVGGLFVTSEVPHTVFHGDCAPLQPRCGDGHHPRTGPQSWGGRWGRSRPPTPRPADGRELC